MVEIPIKGGGVALVDDDFAHLVRYRWRLRDGYPCRVTRRAGSRSVVWRPLHREVMPDAPQQVDHRNLNKLDNQRSNLRPATNAQNHANMPKVRQGARSRFKGVTKHKGGKWQATVTCQGRQYHLGLFVDEEDAARAYDAAAREHFGAFARPNFGEAL